MLDRTSNLPSEWSKARVDLLKELWAAGKSAQAVAQILGGVTRSAVLGKLYRLKMPQREKDSRPRLSMLQRILNRREVNRNNQRRRRNRIRIVQRDRSEPVPITHEAALEFLHKQLLDLTSTDCRYPDGEGPYTFCGQHTERGTSWCRHHLRIVERQP